MVQSSSSFFRRSLANATTDIQLSMNGHVIPQPMDTPPPTNGTRPPNECDTLVRSSSSFPAAALLSASFALRGGRGVLVVFVERPIAIRRPQPCSRRSSRCGMGQMFWVCLWTGPQPAHNVIFLGIFRSAGWGRGVGLVWNGHAGSGWVQGRGGVERCGWDGQAVCGVASGAWLGVRVQAVNQINDWAGGRGFGV